MNVEDWRTKIIGSAVSPFQTTVNSAYLVQSLKKLQSVRTKIRFDKSIQNCQDIMLDT